MKSTRIPLYNFLAATGCLLLMTAARADELPEGFPCRRPLTFKLALSDAPGTNAAVAEFYTDGQAKPNGSDIRITNAQRLEVPFKILQLSKDNDFVRVAFATPGEGPYYAWWGNPKPPAPAKELEIQRGIYAEIYRTPPNAGRDTRSADGLDKLFDKAKPPVGGVFVPEIFLAYNPLGEEWETMFHYAAQFKIDKPIRAQFAFTVANSGMLAIDGKTVAQEFRGGLHGKVRDPKTVDLNAGWHKIEVTQVNLDGGQTGVVVAWKKPGDANYAPLPAAVFAPIAQATPGPLEKVGDPAAYVPDFAIVPEAETFSPPDSYLQRYTFSADFPASFKPKLSWDFGDGQTGGDVKRISHMYLVPGNYTVKFRLELNGNAFTATRRITVKDRMYSRFPRPPEDNAKTAADVLKDDNLEKLTGEQALKGLLYFQSKKENDNTILWGKAWAQKKDTPRPQVLLDETADLADLLESRKDYKAASALLNAAAAKPVAMETRVTLLRQSVIAACDGGEDVDAALKEAQAWRKTINDTSKDQVRGVQVALMYAAIAKGDGKLAQATLEEAVGKDPALVRAYNEAQIRQGVLARNIENYIRTRDFGLAEKLVDDWEVEFPEAMWEGFTRTLRVKLAVAQDRPAVAARIALAHAQANPGGFYAAELLFRAAENFKAAADEPKAKAAMDLLTSKYPESPYARGDKKE